MFFREGLARAVIVLYHIVLNENCIVIGAGCAQAVVLYCLYNGGMIIIVVCYDVVLLIPILKLN
jgi:hypothetical protein